MWPGKQSGQSLVGQPGRPQVQLPDSSQGRTVGQMSGRGSRHLQPDGTDPGRIEEPLGLGDEPRGDEQPRIEGHIDQPIAESGLAGVRTQRSQPVQAVFGEEPFLLAVKCPTLRDVGDPVGQLGLDLQQATPGQPRRVAVVFEPVAEDATDRPIERIVLEVTDETDLHRHDLLLSRQRHLLFPHQVRDQRDHLIFLERG